MPRAPRPWRRSRQFYADMPRRRWLVVAIVVSLVTTFSAGWYMARRFQSPAQREASATPPTARAIFETVRSGPLEEAVSTSGTTAPRFTTDIELINPPTRAVATSVRARVGQELGLGDPIVEINGRPLLVLPGKFPFYRDLAPGASGPDVRQLQAALARAGLLRPGQEPGQLGAATTDAVHRLYQRAGYSPPSTVLSLPEVVVVPVVPVTVTAVVPLGGMPSPDSAVAQVGWGPTVFKAPVANGVAAQLRVGTAATANVNGSDVALRVAAIQPAQVAGPSSPALSSDGQTTVLLEVIKDAPTLGTRAAIEIRLRLLVASALLVPTRAVSRTPGGATQVLRASDGGVDPVRVKVVGELAGTTAIEPVAGERLSDGDRVQVA